MKITIDVPDIMPANFAHPSLEFLKFIREFQELCIKLNREYRRVDDWCLFTASIRNGVDTVFCTESKATKPTRFCDRPESQAELVGDDWSGELIDDIIVMEADLPGNWVVARLCIEEWKDHFVTLRSSDFKSKDGESPKAQSLLAEITNHLASIAHRVPGVSESAI